VEFVLVAPPQHRFSQRENISFRELNGEPVVLREKGSGSRAAILRRFDKYGIKPSVIIEAGSLDFIVRYVKQGKGISFMFEPDIKEELEKGILKVIPIEEGNILFFADIVYHCEQPLSPPAQALLKIVEESRTQSKGELRADLVPPSSVFKPPKDPSTSSSFILPVKL
jgi:DNA-binding transcriptional LysR family regulator